MVWRILTHYEGDVYETVNQFSQQDALAYVHFRNIQGKAPHYREVLVDEDDVYIIRILKILHHNGYDGVLIPDFTSQMTCDAPWHTGMVYTLGYMKACLHMLNI